MSGICVYGFTTLEGANRIAVTRVAIDGARIRPVIAGGHAAIISRRPRGQRFSGKRAAQAQRLRIYRRVLETVMVFAPVLPARFETVLPGDMQLRTFMNRCGTALDGPVDHYGMLIQFEISVTWSTDDAISRLRKDGIIGKRFADNADRDQAAAAALRTALDGHRLALKERIRASLAGVALDIIETPAGVPEAVANFTILLRRKDDARLATVLERLNQETGQQLRFKGAGPLPACSFAAVEIGDTFQTGVTYAEQGAPVPAKAPSQVQVPQKADEKVYGMRLCRADGTLREAA